MQKDYYYRHPETDRKAYPKIDRCILRQQALARYRHLKHLNKSNLSLDDQIFVENFEAAIRLLWGFQKVEITTFFDSVPIPIEGN
ncbi:MAG TPA: hypothetical protein V6D14_20010 [Coleofasciculaceae cyanobacterium]|jgi:hypothetical protein